MSVVIYSGEDKGEMIASGTNPWVEVNGEPVDWLQFQFAAPKNDCDGCADCPIPGTIPAMDTPDGIQRCDQCQRFPGDLDAAFALARLVGGVAKFETDDKNNEED